MTGTESSISTTGTHTEVGASGAVTELRRAQIVEAATPVFTRYGFTRTTMGEIAQAAGISRPTLYAAFPDKTGVFDAVITQMITSELDRIRSGLALHPTLRDQLIFACESWTAPGFAMVRANPDARDLFDQRFQAVIDGDAAFTSILEELLMAALPAGSEADTHASASVISMALQGFKTHVRDETQLKGQIRTLVALVTSGPWQG